MARTRRQRRRRYLPLKKLGFDGTPVDPSSYIAPPASHRLAA